MEHKEENNKRIVEKFNEIQQEILNFGWNGIVNYYHPDQNSSHPDSFKIFQLYKEIFDNMKKRAMIEIEHNNTENSLNSTSKNERIIEKFNEVQNEIFKIGWKGVLETYHPDIYIDHPDSWRIFQLYREILENMKKRLIIEMTTDEPNQKQTP